MRNYFNILWNENQSMVGILIYYVIIILKLDQQSVTSIKNTIDNFCKVSGMTVNMEK